jgi:small subunit ribosomal protein S6
MIIFDTGVEPPAIQAVVDRTLDVIRSTGGNPGAIDRWGRRPFAYEVRHKREGYYVLIELAGENRTVSELDRMLALADEVIRHKVIRLPDKVAGRRGVGATGATTSPGTGATTSPGTGASASPGTGASASPGTGASASPGTGASASPGTGASASSGSAGAAPAASGSAG